MLGNHTTLIHAGNVLPLEPHFCPFKTFTIILALAKWISFQTFDNGIQNQLPNKGESSVGRTGKKTKLEEF